jgi:hypothetical protein
MNDLAAFDGDTERERQICANSAPGWQAPQMADNRPIWSNRRYLTDAIE